MKFFSFVLLMIFVLGCDPPPVDRNLYLSEKSILSTLITWKTIDQLEKETGLKRWGIGEGLKDDRIEMCAISFHYFKEIDIVQARELLLLAANAYLKNINTNEQIRPFLYNDPFQPENIQIRIFLYAPDRSDPKHGALKFVSMINGILSYDVKFAPDKGLHLVHKETYEEAMAHLTQQQSSSI